MQGKVRTTSPISPNCISKILLIFFVSKVATLSCICWDLWKTPLSKSALRAQQKIISHFYIPSSRHLRPISNHKNIKIACYSISFCGLRSNKSNMNQSANSAKLFFVEPLSAQSLRCIRILILEIFNILLWVKSSCALILNEIERFSKVSCWIAFFLPFWPNAYHD